MRWLGLFLKIVLIVVVGILPTLIFLSAEGRLREDFHGFYWDDATGVIISRSVNDRAGNLVSCLLKEYEGILTYTYIYQGNEVTKTERKCLEAGEIKFFNKKYYRGAKIKLKIDPQNPSEILFDIGYVRAFFAMIFAIIGSLAILIISYFYVLPNTLRRFKREISSISVEDLFKEIGLKNIDPYSINNNDEKSPQSDREKEFWTAVPAPHLVISPYAIKDSEFNITITTRINQIAIVFLMTCVGILSLPFDSNTMEKIVLFVVVFFFVYLLEVYLPEMEVVRQRQFDKSSGYYWEGKKSFAEIDKKNPKESHLIKLSLIKTLQILSYEYRHDCSNFYQLNIVEKDGTRTNVINCDRLKTVLKLADKIAGFLNVQVLVDPKITREVLIKC